MVWCSRLTTIVRSLSFPSLFCSSNNFFFLCCSGPKLWNTVPSFFFPQRFPRKPHIGAIPDIIVYWKERKIDDRRFASSCYVDSRRSVSRCTGVNDDFVCQSKNTLNPVLSFVVSKVSQPLSGVDKTSFHQNVTWPVLVVRADVSGRHRSHQQESSSARRILVGLFEPWRWDWYVVPKRRYQTTNLRRITSQKSEGLNSVVAKAWDLS